MASSAFKAYLALVPKLDSGAESQVKSELSGIDVGSSGEKLGAAFGSRMLKAFAALGIANAVASIFKESVASYAEYEQLVGGVDTLFKESSATIQQYAADAYKTAGLSANAYMEQATSFSASLIQSLGGDTAKAAEYANLAITDMGDNANKMGTSIESIQNAYQGFAKQNYTMLDNLKLGYGGTKSEMERLIADANKLREEQGLTADLTIESYADIVEAIHTVQAEMGITGTTAAEAADTIEGSVNSMRAAWTNFMTALAGSGDIEKSAKDLVTTVANVIKNFIPVIVEVAEQLIIMLPDVIAMLIPVLIDAIGNLANAIFMAVGNIVTKLSTTVFDWLNSVPPVVQAFFGGIVEQLAQFISGVLASVAGLINSVVVFFTGLWDTLVSTVAGMWASVVSGFASGIESAVSLVASLPGRILDIFAGIGSWLYDSGRSLIEGFINGIMGAINWAISCVSDALSGIRDLFPFSPAKDGPFSGKGWTLYSGMAIAESLGEGFERQIDKTVSKVNRAMGSLHSSFALDTGTAGNSTAYNITMNVTADSTTTLESLIHQAELARVAYGRG